MLPLPTNVSLHAVKMEKPAKVVYSCWKWGFKEAATQFPAKGQKQALLFFYQTATLRTLILNVDY